MKKILLSDETDNINPRPTKLGLFTYLKTNRSALMAVFAVAVIATAFFAFALGYAPTFAAKDKPAQAQPDTNLEQKIKEQELICLEIEVSDEQKQSESIKEENQAIKDEMESVRDEKESYREELEEKILGSLLSNLENKKLASRSYSLNSYIDEAKNLLDLNWKLIKFKDSPDYDLMDISAYEKALTERLRHIPTLKPIAGSFPGYGWRIHPIRRVRQFHPAADQGAAYGTPVKAAASGYVSEASYNGSSGYYVVINHGNGFVTKYLHHSKNMVRAGEYVAQGQVIANVGSTGSSTHPHLHFETWFNGSPFDPRRILMQ